MKIFPESRYCIPRCSYFLNLSPYQLKQYNKENSNNYPELDISTRSELNNYYDGYNLKLYKYLGVDFDWCKINYSKLNILMHCSK